MPETGGQPNWQLGDSGPVGSAQQIDAGSLGDGAPPSTDPTTQLGDTSSGIVVLAFGAPDSKPTSRRRHWLVATVALLIAAATAVIVAFALTSGGTSYKVAHGPLWVAGQKGQQRVSVVTIVVKNTGKTTASPTCVIRANYLGSPLKPVTITESPPIQPGGVRIYINHMPIPVESAQFVKQSDITVACH